MQTRRKTKSELSKDKSFFGWNLLPSKGKVTSKQRPEKSCGWDRKKIPARFYLLGQNKISWYYMDFL